LNTDEVLREILVGQREASNCFHETTERWPYQNIPQRSERQPQGWEQRVVQSLLAFIAFLGEMIERVVPYSREASSVQKTLLLDTVVAVTGYARKYAIGLLNQAQVGKRFSTGCVARRKLIWESWEKRTKEASS